MNATAKAQPDTFTAATKFAEKYLANEFSIDMEKDGEIEIQSDRLVNKVELDIANLVYEMSAARGVLDYESEADLDALNEEAYAFECAIHVHMSSQGFSLTHPSSIWSHPCPAMNDV